MDTYSQKVLEHFRNPQNAGEIADPDGIGEVGNPQCGDMMKITIKVEGGKLSDIKWKTLGCGAAIATSSVMTEMMRGKTLDEAMALTRDKVADALDGLPPAKMHCSNLAADGLRAAIADYLKRHSIPGQTEKGG
ncbi:MAG: Fe-S cluster assembly scaffold protein NifU [Planctomycetota bacterium]|jgi:nitrogen fixation NifU-like protein|nr:Fe-S cluster assembly scaffold protein NifU [Planctomycetota bacterium]